MKKKILIICLCISGVLLLSGLYFFTKFKNFEIELGTDINIDNAIAYGTSKGVSFDISKVNKNAVGTYPVLLKYLFFEYNLTVNVVDKTPPVLEVKNVEKELGYNISVNDFIVNVSDASKYEVNYSGDVNTSKYGEYDVNISAKDIYGNIQTKVAKLSIRWLKSEYLTEEGEKILAENLVYDKKDKDTILQNDLDEINSKDAGVYYLNSTKGEAKAVIKIEKIKDKTPPELELKTVTIYDGKKINSINDFVKKAKDKKSDVSLKILSNIDYKKLGKQTVTIMASDAEGNTVTKDTTLNIIKDTERTKISGLSKITIKKDKTIDYKKGVSSYDKNTGKCSFTVDSSKVDIHKYGTYVAYYTSKDGLGNTTKSKRVIVVTHDKSDTNAKVQSVAKTLPKDAEKIRDWVRNNIKYNTNWGGDDPIWYGLTNKAGNCFVRAKILDALLKAKGFTTRLIWTTYKSHYWNMVYLNGKWYHIDSTPMAHHAKYSLMNDEQRLEGLSGRTWDRKSWPKAG